MLVNPTDNQVEQLVYAELYSLLMTRSRFTAEDVLKTLKTNNKSFKFDLQKVAFHVNELMRSDKKIVISTVLEGTGFMLRQTTIDLNKDYEYTITSPDAHTKMWFPKENPPEPITVTMKPGNTVKVEYNPSKPIFGDPLPTVDYNITSILDILYYEGDDEDDY